MNVRYLNKFKSTRSKRNNEIGQHSVLELYSNGINNIIDSTMSIWFPWLTSKNNNSVTNIVKNERGTKNE